jgi:hypothetical protein
VPAERGLAIRGRKRLVACAPLGAAAGTHAQQIPLQADAEAKDLVDLVAQIVR